MSGISEPKYILGTVILLMLSAGFVKSSFDVVKSGSRLEEINREVAILEQKKSEIEKDIEYRNSEEYIEEKARNELNLIRPGEEVYVVVGGENNSASDVLSEADIRGEDEKKESNWYSWYKLFFDN